MPKVNAVVDLYVVYEIIRRLSKPFVETEAYEAGLIDEDGNLTKKRRDMTRDERKLVTHFDVMIFNLKKLLAKLPGGDSRLRNLATSLWLLKEEIEEGNEFITEEVVMSLAEDVGVKNLKTYAELMEESAVAVNSIGGGSISDKTVAISKKKQREIVKSNIGKCRVYNVDGKTYSKCRLMKSPKERFSKFVEEEDTLSDVREYAKNNPSHSIMVHNPTTGGYLLLKRGSKHLF